MLRLGITGGIGSGKSATEKTLRDFGIRVLDADQVARGIG
jgi:dephospho-CoA kinase